MKAMQTTLARFAAAGILAVAVTLPLAGVTHAAGSRPLQASDFLGLKSGYTDFLTNNSSATIAGVHYTRAVSFSSCNNIQGVSLNTRRLAGYKAVSFEVGLIDSNDVSDVMTFTVTADGNPVYTRTLRQGQLAAHVVIAFGKAEVLSFTALRESGPCNIDGAAVVIMGNPIALPGGVQPAPAGGPTTLQIISGTVVAGGLEKAVVTTSARASVVLVINYPDGSQVVLGPKRATSRGEITFTWTVPAGLHGTVRVVAVSTGMAQGTFQAS